MQTRTFAAQVRQGRLEYSESLQDWEGQQVAVTILGLAKGDGMTAPNGAVNSDDNTSGLDVEIDVWQPMRVKGEILYPVEIITEPGRPCIILPEELPDD